VQVLCFGVLKDWFGAESTPVELPASATVAALIEQMSRLAPMPSVGAGIAVSVNAAYVNRSHELCDGDEVALLPPVSGGSASEESAATLQKTTQKPFRSPIFPLMCRDH